MTPALEHVVEANTLLSGLGFESGGLAAPTLFTMVSTVLEQTHKYYHGEKVAFHTCGNWAFLCLGRRTEVAEQACAEGATIHNEPVPVTREAVFGSKSCGCWR